MAQQSSLEYYPAVALSPSPGRVVSMSYPKASLLFLPWSRRELPMWGKLLGMTGVFKDELWKDAPRRQIRGKLHGYLMDLDLSNWSERHTYFIGRFYDLPLQLLIQSALQTGETFVDVGTNIGMISLLAAKRVGPAGIVHSFEPNPQVVQRVRDTLAKNNIQHVIMHPCGLSDSESEMTLSVVTEHTGMATFAQIPDDQKAFITKTHTVKVRRGDDELPADLKGNVMIKVDTEGFECRALRGLEGTINKLSPLVVTEAVGSHLERAGSSLQELFTLLQDMKFLPYALATQRKSLRYKLDLKPLKVPADLKDDNMVWFRPGTVYAERLKSFIG